MSTGGQTTDRQAVQDAAEMCLAAHSDLQDEFEAIKRTAGDLYQVWQSAKTSDRHQQLMEQFNQAFLAEQQNIQEIKTQLDKWGVSIEEATAHGEKVLHETESQIGHAATPTGAPAQAGAGGYLQLISSGETVAGVA
jgi:phage shock protein A